MAAADGSWFPWFGVFNRHLGTPVGVNVMSGILSTIFVIVGVAFFIGFVIQYSAEFRRTSSLKAR